jgi:hypothetical protein
MLAGLALLGAAMGSVVNVNRFSLHGLYRNRLVRAYLGASRSARQEDRFTGFSLRDDVRMHALWPRGALDGVDPTGDAPTFDALDAAGHAARPMPIVNAALNLVRGDQLAWQHRKAESFTFTPLYCGNVHEGYRDTRRYGGPAGVALGTAMTISGAAASPNMGYHSSPAVTFLMTLFNARLGAWLGNTNEHGDRTFDRAGPNNALGLLVTELLGRTDARRPFVNLSDGGHFENLALYEVVLRRCRRVLACDAGCDPEHGFGDLGNAVRKVRIDSGSRSSSATTS